MSRRDTGNTFYILDEPTTGLHFEDVRKLLAVLHELSDRGNTVLVIEHNLDVIKNCDWVIDMGPEGGGKGGYVVAEGTPEQVATIEKSYTGHFLQGSLEGSGQCLAAADQPLLWLQRAGLVEKLDKAHVGSLPSLPARICLHGTCPVTAAYPSNPSRRQRK